MVLCIHNTKGGRSDVSCHMDRGRGSELPTGKKARNPRTHDYHRSTRYYSEVSLLIPKEIMFNDLLSAL